MNWSEFQRWNEENGGNFASSSRLDGYLTGKLLSLEASAQDQIINDLIAHAIEAKKTDVPANVRSFLSGRMIEIEASLIDKQRLFAPMLDTDEDGEFQLKAWVNGLQDAMAPDFEMWTYILGDSPEAGAFALLISHAEGDFARIVHNFIDKHPRSEFYVDYISRQWALMPGLMRSLYKKALVFRGQ